jgi:hypothetical protein
MGMMLSILTKRLCPLMSLAIAFGCGKKINDPTTTEINRTGQTQTQELPSTLKIEVNEQISAEKVYTLPRNAWFRLPSKLIAKEASAVGKRVKIYYNFTSDNEYEFHCYYKSITQAAELSFEKCQSSDDVTIISTTDDLEKMEFPMDKGTAVKAQLLNPSQSGIKINSVYSVDWK